MIKRFFLGFVVLFAVFAVALMAVKSNSDANYFMLNDPSLPVSVELSENAIVDEPVRLFGVEMPRNYRRTEFQIEARPGDWVPCVLTQPVDFEGRLPTILFVHGAGQSKSFVERISSPFNEAGFNMVSWDQWGQGDRQNDTSGIGRLTEWHDRGWKAVHEAQRIMDYLVTRDDVDPDRLYIVGASYGSMVTTHVLAQDKRYDAAILLVGGGDFRIMADAPLIKDAMPGALHAVLKPAFVWMGKAFDPIHSAPNTGPIPILKQCGSADILVTPESGQALFDALAEPKELRWYDIDHPGLRDGDGPEIIRLLDDGLAWLAEHAGIPADQVRQSYPMARAQLQEQ